MKNRKSTPFRVAYTEWQCHGFQRIIMPKKERPFSRIADERNRAIYILCVCAGYSYKTASIIFDLSRRQVIRIVAKCKDIYKEKAQGC